MLFLDLRGDGSWKLLYCCDINIRTGTPRTENQSASIQKWLWAVHKLIDVLKMTNAQNMMMIDEIGSRRNGGEENELSYTPIDS